MAFHFARVQASNAYARLQKIKEENKEMINTVVSSTETIGTTIGLGVMEGYRGSMPKVGGMTVDVLGGVALHLLAFSPYGKGAASHLHAVANGALCYWGAGKGLKWGMDWKAKKASGPQPAGFDYSRPAYVPPQVQPQQLAQPQLQPAWSGDVARMFSNYSR